MIDLREWEPIHSTLQPGETCRVNHDGCPAGEDRRKRLYLTRPASSPGVVLGFCHNCQEHGTSRTEMSRYRNFHRDDNRHTVTPVDFMVPNGMIDADHDWPFDAKRWRMYAGLDEEQCKNACIQYDPSSNRVYLPMYSEINKGGEPHHDSQLQGFQLRQIDGTGPKYYTAMKDGTVVPFTRMGGTITYYSILVEDLASGLNVAKLMDKLGKRCNVVVNYGVKIKPEMMYHNKQMHVGVVWLDNDSVFIKRRAQEIARTWALISDKPMAVVEYDEGDPKHASLEVIQELVQEWKKNDDRQH